MKHSKKAFTVPHLLEFQTLSSIVMFEIRCMGNIVVRQDGRVLKREPKDALYVLLHVPGTISPDSFSLLASTERYGCTGDKGFVTLNLRSSCI